MIPVEPGPKIEARDRFGWIGAPIITRDEMLFAAERFDAGDPFLELVEAFYAEYELRLAEQEEFRERPQAPCGIAIQSSAETGWGRVHAPTGRYLRSPGAPGDSAPYNPLGIKKADRLISTFTLGMPDSAGYPRSGPGSTVLAVGLSAEAEKLIERAHEGHGPVPDHESVVFLVEDDIPKMFEVPSTAKAGAHLGFNHRGAYLGLPPMSPPNSRLSAAQSVGQAFRDRNGRWADRWQDWGNAPTGVWATDPAYFLKLRTRQEEILAAVAERRARAKFTGRR